MEKTPIFNSKLQHYCLVKLKILYFVVLDQRPATFSHGLN